MRVLVCFLLLLFSTSAVAADRFPDVPARNLAKQELRLPAAFTHDFNVVFVVFARNQQDEVESWIPLFSEVGKDRDDVQYWQASLMGTMGKALRAIVEGAMRGAIKEPDRRERFFLLYGDKAPILTGLGEPDDEHLLMLLVDRDGAVIWRASGARAPASEAALRAALQRSGASAPPAP